MDPMVVDVLGCLDVGQWSDKTLLADAGGAEVKEIIGYQAAEGPSPYSMGCVGDISVCLSFYSEVIQFQRCTLTVKRLFVDVGVRLLAKLISRWFDLKFKIINCKAAAWSVETIGELFRRSIGLFGFDLKRTLICQRLVYFCLYEVICLNTSLRLFGY